MNLKREDGVAMTEFALIVPIFLLIVAGLLSFGRVFFYWIEANHMASETARWAVVDRNPYGPPDAPAARGAELDDRVRERRAGVHRLPETATVDLGEPVRVRIQKPFSFVPILGIGQITIRGTSTMRIERLSNNGAPGSYARPRARHNNGTCT